MTAPERVCRLFACVQPLRGLIEAALSHGQIISPEGAAWALLETGDFLICGGEPDAEAALALEELIRMSPVSELLVYAPGAWKRTLQETGVPFALETRWAFDHGCQPDDEHLRRLLSGLPDGVSIRPIGEAEVRFCRNQAWTRDFVSQYPTCAAYAREGLGVLLYEGDIPAAGAGSYVSYPGGIEIQVETAAAYRGRGYAVLASAALILRAHERGLRATWDAANEASAHIASKLGYRPLGPYEICVVCSTDLM